MAEPRFTLLGKLLSVLLIGGLIAAGAYMVLSRRGEAPAAPDAEQEAAAGDSPAVAEVQVEVPTLSPPRRADQRHIVPIEISEYALRRSHRRKRRARANETPYSSSSTASGAAHDQRGRDWSALTRQARGVGDHRRRPAVTASSFTPSCRPDRFLARRRRPLVRSDIKRITRSREVIATAPFTEWTSSSAIWRRSGVPSSDRQRRRDADPDRINLIYTDEASCGRLFLSDLKSGKTGSPRRDLGAEMSECRPERRQGAPAHDEPQSLIVADVLVVHADSRSSSRNRGRARPWAARGNGWSARPRHVSRRRRPAFKWTRDETKSELAGVHLSNLPKPRLLLREIDDAGSFGGIYQSAVYGTAPLSSRIRSCGTVRRSEASAGARQVRVYKDQKIAIAPFVPPQRGRSRRIRC